MRIVVIGIGDVGRRDSGAGPYVTGVLRRLGLPGVTVVDSDGSAEDLVDRWAGADLAVVVNAVHAPEGTPGQIYRLGLHHPSATGSPGAGTRPYGIGAAVRLARAEGRMPHRLLLFGLQAATMEPGTGLTPAVAAGAAQVVDDILDLIEAAGP